MTPAPTFQGTTLQVRRTLAASRETVFRAWTDPAWFGQWFGSPEGSTDPVELDVRVGGTYRIEMTSPQGAGSLVGEYLEVERPERLVYTFCWEGLPLHIPDTQVTVEFHDLGAETEIVLTHERQPSRSVRTFHVGGWEMSLTRLAELLEAGAAEVT
jgi:uncharacterized protein YndB with AHSA1/START domain